jgi:serine phosphatase RsbU (regulator of sigma subunit)
MGATCLYAVYDPAGQSLTVARAGHPPPILVSPAGEPTFPEIPAGMPIGMGLPLFERVELDVPEDTVIALFTDGLVETRSEDIDVGLNRLADALARPGVSLEDLCAAAVGAMHKQAAPDDATLLLAKTRARRD